MTRQMEYMVRRFLESSYDIDFEMLENMKESKTSIQLDRIIISKFQNLIEGFENINLSLVVMELEMMFDISRNDAFWSLHDWLMKETKNYIRCGGSEEAATSLKQILGWFTQMV